MCNRRLQLAAATTIVRPHAVFLPRHVICKYLYDGKELLSSESLRVLVVTCTGLDDVIRVFPPKIKTKIIVNDNEFTYNIYYSTLLYLLVINYNNLHTLILRWSTGDTAM